MSYIQSIKIASNLTKSIVEAEDYDKFGYIVNSIKTALGWKTFEGTNIFQLGEYNHLNLGLQYSNGAYSYKIYTSSKNYYTDTNTQYNDVEYSIGVGAFQLDSTNKPMDIYLHYCKSTDGKTIGVGLNCYMSNSTVIPKIDFIIADDENGNISIILLGNMNVVSQMICNGDWCYINGTSKTTSGENYSYAQTGTKTLTTSICKMPNFLKGCMFKSLYKILSCPIEPVKLYTAPFDIDGKRYQGVNPNSNSYSSFAILTE